MNSVWSCCKDQSEFVYQSRLFSIVRYPSLLNRTSLSTNRGNFLLKRILESRYPELFRPGQADEQRQSELLDSYLSVQESAQKQLLTSIDSSQMESFITTAALNDGGPRNYPSTLGENLGATDKTKLILYLVSSRGSKYLKVQPIFVSWQRLFFDF